MTITLKISDKYSKVLEENPAVIEELLENYSELQEDKKTKFNLENSDEDKNLNIALISALWI